MTWSFGPTLLRDLAHSLELLDAGQRREPVSVRWRDAGAAAQQAVVRVFPATLKDHALYAGFAGDLWLQPGAVAAPGAAAAALGGDGELCLVLGAGNHALLSLADVAHKCLVRGAVCVLKMNPVNEWAGPSLEFSLQPLINAGAVRIVYGGPTVGQALAAHPAIQTVRACGAACDGVSETTRCALVV